MTVVAIAVFVVAYALIASDRINKTLAELEEERQGVAHLL